MPRIALAFAALLALCPVLTRADVSPDAIVGVWLTETADSKIEIGKAGTGYAGKVIWLKEPQRDGKPVTDAKNADASLRTRPLLGLEAMSNIVYAGGGKWTGNLYSPRKGRSFAAELTVHDGKLDVKVKEGILSKTVTWTSVK
jgi:uncharacterized protein (DUF2147 family)